MKVSFSDPATFNFVRMLLERPAMKEYQIAFQDQELSVELGDPLIAKLLLRAQEQHPLVLPSLGKDRDAWLFTGHSRRDVDRVFTQLSRFVVPSYAEFGSDSGGPVLRAFKREQGGLHAAGAELFPLGYYSWYSPRQFRSNILAAIGTWLALQEAQPALYVAPRHVYRDLYDVFASALAAHNWPEAETALREIERQNLSTADNLAFLNVQFLAQQQNWRALWDDREFGTLARLRMPRAVRAALLMAFHQSELLPLEQGGLWAQALEAFVQARPRLGRLLTTRLGLTEPAVLQVFAYEAGYSKDRLAFEEIRALPVASNIEACLRFVEGLLPPVPAVASVLTPLQMARIALEDRDFDAALRAAESVADMARKSALLLEIAENTRDLPLAERALLFFWDLPDQVQRQLQQSVGYVAFCLKELQTLVSPPSPAAVPAIDDWLEWFERASANPADQQLQPALERLEQITDERFWLPERIARLNELLLPFTLDAQSVATPLIRTALRRLTDFFLRDINFPRLEDPYPDLYETLYLGVLETAKVNETSSLALLRLAEARLRQNSTVKMGIGQDLQNWFKDVVPALETAVLDAFELLSEFGLEPSMLLPWYRTWLTHLLELPTRRDRTNLEVWRSFASWVQPGVDLLTRLDSLLQAAREQDTDNPIAELQTGFRIGIFTLRASSADRARELILARNSALDVRICMETVMSDQARSIAQHSDMVVVVTTCITHALTNGISSYINNDPVYPASSGSTSIVRAIEAALRKSSG